MFAPSLNGMRATSLELRLQKTWQRLEVLLTLGQLLLTFLDASPAPLLYIVVSRLFWDLIRDFKTDVELKLFDSFPLFPAGSGARSAVAIEVLLNNGFNGTLYNGQGIIQWTGAGYSLDFDPSVTPPCTVSNSPTRDSSNSPTRDSSTGFRRNLAVLCLLVTYVGVLALETLW